MTRTINLELIQDKDTNIIIYDGSNEGNTTIDWLPVDKITSIYFSFLGTSDNLTHTKTFIMDNSNKAITISNIDYSGNDFSTYLADKTTTFIINGEQREVHLLTNIPNISALVIELNNQLTGLAVVTAFGNRLKIATITTGSTASIQILTGTLNGVIGLEEGIYRGNDIYWNTANITRRDLLYVIYPEDMGFVDEFPISKWDITYTVSHTDITTPIINVSYTEYTFKQIELYRALTLEHYAKTLPAFTEVEQRLLTDYEVHINSFIVFDSAYKAFKAAINVGNYLVVDKLLLYLSDYIKNNPLILDV